MKTQVRSAWGAGAALAVSILMSGCVVAPASVPYAVAADGVYAPVAPPAPQMEVIPPIPFVGAVWIGGYWGWSGGRHVWVQGHYSRPNPGFRWQPHQWVQRPGGGWVLHGGRWVR